MSNRDTGGRSGRETVVSSFNIKYTNETSKCLSGVNLGWVTRIPITLLIGGKRKGKG